MEIIVNFKNYKIGDGVLKLTKFIEKILPKAMVAVPALNLKEISEKTKLRVFAQHLETINYGTGYVTDKAVRKIGIKGTLINHSENKIPIKEYKLVLRSLERSKIKTIACASSIEEVKLLMKHKPWAIAYEDPKLIGTKKSVTRYAPREIKKFVGILKKSNIIPVCGAGISSINDIIQAKKLGCKGILISSAIANSSPKRAEKFLKDISQILE